MSELVVLVPVLDRPHRVEPTIKGFRETVPDARILFLASPNDEAELQELASVDADTLVVKGGYARKIAVGIESTSEPLLFLAADDLIPQSGWLEAAEAALHGRIEVVGVNDMIDRFANRKARRRVHATHFLMTRNYAEQPTIDGEPGPLSEAYDHSFQDDELIATAIKRGAYRYVKEARVKHLHPMDGGDDDSTYRLGRRHFKRDRSIFEHRKRTYRF